MGLDWRARPTRRSVRRTALLAFVLVLFAFVTGARAQPAEPFAPADAKPALMATTPSAEGQYDEVLRRLLRSGCRDGLEDARALAANGGASWAETVTRLCGEILAAPAPRLAAAPRPRADRAERNGRGTIVVWSTLYGIWAGIALDVLFSNDGARAAILPPLLGMGAGLALSLALTAEHPVTNGEAWATVTGLQYGSFNGAFWAGAFDLTASGVVRTSLVTGLAAGAAGLVVTNQASPAQGDVEVVRSGLLWGTAAGLLGLATFTTNASAHTYYRGAAVSMDLGFLAGLALASSFDVSRNRDLIIDAGTLGGGVAGLGVAALVVSGPNASGRAVAAGGLVGLAVGMLATIYFTRDMDRDEEEGSPVAALLGRDARGRWRWGTPGPEPVLDGLGHHVIGATLTAVGGVL